MRSKMILFFLFFTVFCILIKGDPNTEPIFTAADKSNARGYYRNPSLSQHGQEIIGDYDGNFMLKYSSSVDLPNGLGGEFSLTYNAGVEHRLFTDPLGGYYNKSGIGVNAPAWIIGFKGIALQTLNFENRYYLREDNYVAGTEVPLLIPGYHFSNKMCSTNPEVPDYDFIRILKSDGSTIKLIQSSEAGLGWSNNDGDLGGYVEMGSENYGYAYVDRLDTENSLRKMWYKPGDGLTYYFEERFLDPYTEYGPLDEAIYSPKHFLLLEVTSTVGDTLVLKYENGFGGRSCFTRAFFKRAVEEVAGGHITNYPLIFSSAYNTPHHPLIGGIVLADIELGNATGKDYKLYFNPNEQNVLTSTAWDETKTKRYNISYISDNLSNMDTIEYSDLAYNKSRLYESYQINDNLTIKVDFKLIEKIKYYSGKNTTLIYYDQYFGRQDNSIIDLTNPVYSYNNINITEKFRDAYTNFIIKSRTVSEHGVELFTENYDYSFIKPYTSAYDIMNAGRINDIKTIITFSPAPGSVQSLPFVRKITKKFSKFRSGEYDFLTWGYNSKIKLIEERISEYTSGTETNYTIKNYSWDIGTESNSNNIYLKAYSGTFRPVNTITSSSQQELGESIIYTYGPYDSLFTDLHLGNNIKLVPSFILEKQKNIYSKTILKNDDEFLLFDWDYIFPNNLYKLNAVKERIVYSASDGSLINKHIKYDYGGLTGKIISIIDTLAEVAIRTNFQYYNDKDNEYFEGYLKTVDFDNQYDQRFEYLNYYDPELEGTDTTCVARWWLQADATGNILMSDGLLLSNTEFIHKNYQTKPFKTTTKYGNDSVTYITAYNRAKELEFSIDVNNYYSQYSYDPLNRVKEIKLPGGFYFGQDSVIKSKPIQDIDYFDNTKTIQLTKTFSDDTLDTNTLTIIERHDIFGNIIESQKESVIKIEGTSNAYGLNATSTDGEGIIVKRVYDYLGRPTKFIYLDGSYSIIEYHGLDPNFLLVEPYLMDSNYDYDIVSINETKLEINEIGDTTRSYYDVFGNLRAIMKLKIKENGYNSTNVIITKFAYDGLNRLIGVKSPGGKITSYSYDARGNIKERISPDDGKYQYQYDKYGNLRFSIHYTSTPHEMQFKRYDLLNRTILSGKIPANQNVIETENYDPNLLYDTGTGSFENLLLDIDKFLIVNQYDDFSQTGVFSASYVSYPTINLRNMVGRISATAFRSKLTDTWNYKLYSYDHKGRIEALWVKYGSESWKKISTEYDNLDNITKQFFGTYVHNNLLNEFFYWYDYDNEGRLWKVYTNEEDVLSTRVFEVEYDYNNADQITDLEFSTIANAEHSETVSYNYNNTRGWLETIKSEYQDEILDEERFYENLTYLSNGNISSMKVRNESVPLTTQLINNYSYDGLNRLLSVDCDNNLYDESFTYDLDGNIKQKNNNFRTSSYLYYGGTNKLAIYEKSENSQYTEHIFTYDNRGNVIVDNLRGISSFQYDHRNLPLSMVKDGQTYNYDYDDTGNRIYKYVLGEQEYYLRDHTGKELAVYDLSTGKLKFVNIFGNGLIGRVEIVNVEDEDEEQQTE